jgi:hypothetical protein
MVIDRKKLYRFPWTTTDNPFAWLEVTDECNLICPGCFRHKLEGHRSLSDIKNDVIACQKMRNCDVIRIAGGEPLIYPHLLEVVNFISKNNMRPVVITNGEKLTWKLACELKKAGMFQILFHIDSNQQRPGWTGKTEMELNELRQKFADLIWELKGVQCGFHVTVFHSNLNELPEIVEWCRKNIHKVQHLRIIAFRGIPLEDGIDYQVNGKNVDLSSLSKFLTNPDDMNISSDQILEIIDNRLPFFTPSAYVNGTSAHETNKLLAIINVGNKDRIFGAFGKKTVEISHLFQHLFKGRYLECQKSLKVGRKVFFLSLFDRELRKAFRTFMWTSVKKPSTLFSKIYYQIIGILQPGEIYNGKRNYCEGCSNMMIHDGKLVISCTFDEYRMFGGPLQPVINWDVINQKEKRNSA